MNRLERLSAILIHLQSKRVVTARELAQRFEIGLRTVYRDMRALEEAGVPIGSEPGLGYYLPEGYHLRPVTLTTEEACALITAGKLAEQLTGSDIKTHVNSALFKIKAVLRESDKAYLAKLEDRISVYNPSGEAPPGFLTELQSALSERKVLVLEYRSYDQESSVRQIEPVSLSFYDGRWHLFAYCRFRSDYRDFRVDRISHLTITAETFDEKRHPALIALLKERFDRQALHTAVLRFDKGTAYGTIKSKCIFGLLEEKDLGDRIELTLRVDSLEVLAAWLRRYTPGVEILAPDALRQLCSKGCFK